MSFLGETFARRILLSGERLGSIRWLLQDLECLFEDEVVVQSLPGEPVPSYACKFTSDGLYGNLLAVSDEGGSVRLFDTRKLLNESLISEIFCHSNAIFDISWLPGGTKLLTASGDCTVGLWDVTCGASLGKFKFHSGSVKSVDSNKNDPCMFVSGGRDGNICVWDTRCSTKKTGLTPFNHILAAHKYPRGKGKINNSSVTSVLFHGTDKLASVGSGGGLVKMWDLRTTYSSCKASPPRAYLSFDLPTGERCGFTSLVADSHNGYLFGTCKNGTIYKYCTNGSITMPVESFKGANISSFYVKSCLSPDDQFLLSGSGCGKGFIWEIDNPEAPPLVLATASEEVAAVSWCPTALDKLVTCSNDNAIRVWRLKRGRGGGNMDNSVIGSCKEYKVPERRKRLQSIENNSVTLSQKKRMHLSYPPCLF